jgi:hypothetical protein
LWFTSVLPQISILGFGALKRVIFFSPRLVQGKENQFYKTAKAQHSMKKNCIN